MDYTLCERQSQYIIRYHLGDAIVSRTFPLERDPVLLLPVSTAGSTNDTDRTIYGYIAFHLYAIPFVK